jgi:hypothetical protein
VFTELNAGAGGTVFTLDHVDIDEKTNVWSAMLNGWVDFGGNGGFGGGVGARVGNSGLPPLGLTKNK